MGQESYYRLPPSFSSSYFPIFTEAQDRLPTWMR